MDLFFTSELAAKGIMKALKASKADARDTIAIYDYFLLFCLVHNLTINVTIPIVNAISPTITQLSINVFVIFIIRLSGERHQCGHENVPVLLSLFPSSCNLILQR